MHLNARTVGMAVCLLVAAPIVGGCATSERSTGQTVDDATVTAKVKSQLLADPAVSGLNVNVTTYDGRVQLSGYVNTSEERSKAEQIAKKVTGVKSVSNDLIVKAQQSPQQ